MKKFIIFSILVGILIPLMFITAWELYYRYSPHSNALALLIFRLQLMLYPSSILMLSTARLSVVQSLPTLFIAILANASLYAVMGYLILVGNRRKRWILYILGGSILLGWYVLLKM